MSVDLLDIHLMCLAMAADDTLNASAVRVGVALLGFLNRKTGRCDPALATLGEAAGMKRSATWEAVTALEKAGWLTAEGAGGRARGNAYTFAFERVKPTGKPDGIDPETVRNGGRYEDQNHPERRTKPSGTTDPNPKEKPSGAKAPERGAAHTRRWAPGAGAGAPRRGRSGKIDPVEAMLRAGGVWPGGDQ